MFKNAHYNKEFASAHAFPPEDFPSRAHSPPHTPSKPPKTQNIPAPQPQNRTSHHQPNPPHLKKNSQKGKTLQAFAIQVFPPHSYEKCLS